MSINGRDQWLPKHILCENMLYKYIAIKIVKMIFVFKFVIISTT